MYNDAVCGNPARHKMHEVAARLRRSMFTVPTSAAAPVPEAALRKFLRGGRVHEVGSTRVDLAPYRSKLVSLPVNLDGSPTARGSRLFGW